MHSANKNNQGFLNISRLLQAGLAHNTALHSLGAPGLKGAGKVVESVVDGGDTGGMAPRLPTPDHISLISPSGAFTAVHQHTTPWCTSTLHHGAPVHYTMVHQHTAPVDFSDKEF